MLKLVTGTLILAALIISEPVFALSPLPEGFQINPNLTGVAVSDDHQCITNITGEITVCRGWNKEGQLGIPADDVYHDEWVIVQAPEVAK